MYVAKKNYTKHFFFKLIIFIRKIINFFYVYGVAKNFILCNHLYLLLLLLLYFLEYVQ